MIGILVLQRVCEKLNCLLLNMRCDSLYQIYYVIEMKNATLLVIPIIASFQSLVPRIIVAFVN